MIKPKVELSKYTIVWANFYVLLCVCEWNISNKRMLELITEFCEVAGSKINTWKSIAFVYTPNCMAEKELIKPATSTTIVKSMHSLSKFNYGCERSLQWTL